MKNVTKNGTMEMVGTTLPESTYKLNLLLKNRWKEQRRRSSSIAGIFLGYLPNTTTNIIWFDPEMDRVKIAKHA